MFADTKEVIAVKYTQKYTQHAMHYTLYIYPMRQYDNTKKNDYYKGQCNWKGLDNGNSFGGYKYKENTDIDSGIIRQIWNTYV